MVNLHSWHSWPHRTILLLTAFLLSMTWYMYRLTPLRSNSLGTTILLANTSVNYLLQRSSLDFPFENYYCWLYWIKLKESSFQLRHPQQGNVCSSFIINYSVFLPEVSTWGSSLGLFSPHGCCLSTSAILLCLHTYTCVCVCVPTWCIYLPTQSTTLQAPLIL